MKGEGDSLFKKISRSFCRWLYRSGDLLLISSQGFEEKLRSMGLKGKIRYFPNYAEPLSPLHDPAVTRESLGLAQGDFVLGFAGNIGRAQALDKLVTAAKDVPGAKYLIAGDGSELESIRESVEREGLGGRFVFTGWVDSAKVPDLLMLCDALLVSLEDAEVLNLAVPAKLQTYLYAGKPVIAFMNGAGARLVLEARCGITAAAGDAAALSQAIAQMANLPAGERGEMGERGKQYCLDHFSRDKVLGDLEDYLLGAIHEYREKQRGQEDARSRHHTGV
jgi:glycosyltransferase involved in cell wall biosynthesis